MTNIRGEVIPAVVLAGCAFLGSLGATPTPEAPEACFVSGEIAPQLPSPEEAQVILAGMKFVLTTEEAAGYREQLSRTGIGDAEEMEDILEEAFRPYDITVESGAIPQTKPEAAQITHQPEEMEAGNLRSYALEQIKVLANTPVQKMEARRGSAIYYTTGLKVNGVDTAGAAVEAGQTVNNQPAIIYDLDFTTLTEQPFNDTPREIIEHEEAHTDVRATCNLGDNDMAFTSLNPSDFKYSADSDDMARAVKDKIVVFGAPVNTDTGEDMALTRQELTTHGFQRCSEDDAEIICGKLMLMAARDAEVYGQEMLSYYVSKTTQTSVAQTR